MGTGSFRAAAQAWLRDRLLLVRDRKFPELIRRRNFFDLTQDRLAGQRALKRWLLERDPFSQRVVELPQEGLGGRKNPDLLEEPERQLADCDVWLTWLGIEPRFHPIRSMHDSGACWNWSG
jgi:hypothetical protein